MSYIPGNMRFRRSLAIGAATAALVGPAWLFGSQIGGTPAANAATAPSVQGTADSSWDNTNGVPEDLITGAGFSFQMFPVPVGGLVNVFVYRQAGALTGPGAEGGQLLLTTQVRTSTRVTWYHCNGRICISGPGSFSFVFDDANSSGCTGQNTYTIEAQDVTNPNTWATATYQSPACGSGATGPSGPSPLH